VKSLYINPQYSEKNPINKSKYLIFENSNIKEPSLGFEKHKYVENTNNKAP